MKLSWKLKETKNWTLWETEEHSYAVEGSDGKYQAFWGWCDHNIRSQLGDGLPFDSEERAKGFCEGHYLRQQELMQNPRYCMRCASEIRPVMQWP